MKHKETVCMSRKRFKREGLVLDDCLDLSSPLWNRTTSAPKSVPRGWSIDGCKWPYFNVVMNFDEGIKIKFYWNYGWLTNNHKSQNYLHVNVMSQISQTPLSHILSPKVEPFPLLICNVIYKCSLRDPYQII